MWVIARGLQQRRLECLHSGTHSVHTGACSQLKFCLAVYRSLLVAERRADAASEHWRSCFNEQKAALLSSSPGATPFASPHQTTIRADDTLSICLADSVLSWSGPAEGPSAMPLPQPDVLEYLQDF